MSDSEVKRKGRPKKRESDHSEVVVSPRKQISNGDDAPPVKRGRGRPPKGGAGKKKPPIVATGRGRGRPPKNAKKAKKESEDEEDNAEDEKKDDDSSCEADSS